jgi:NAD(P)-dependent dehydrogenase (short-subunit alcohol dehydrogenase family)
MGNPLRFDGRVALVTGATSGLGRAYCEMLATRGAKVVVNGNFRASGVGPEAEIAEQIRAAGGDAVGVNGSVLDDGQIEKIVRETIDAYGQIDILINNAGVNDVSMDVLKPDDRLYKQFDIQIVAPMKVTAAAWPYLVQSAAGRIINVASSSAFGAGFDGIWEGAYSACKAAVFAMTRQHAGAGEEYGIHANALLPWGYTRAVEKDVADTDFGRWMKANTTVDKVAAVVAYLVHSDCPANGQFFTAAGGRANRVMFAATRGYFNPDITPEDVAANFDQVRGERNDDGYYDQLFDLTSVHDELVEHRRFIGTSAA